MRVYPNPARSNVTLELSGFSGQVVEISILKTTGKQVQSLQLNEVSNTTELLNLEELESGIYLINIQSGATRMTKRLVIVNR